MEMSWEKTFSMILQIFQFPKTSLNFTLFRNVLFPLNEKYSGLDSFYKEKDWFFSGTPNFFGPSYFEAAL